MVILRAARIPATATEAVPAMVWTKINLWPLGPSLQEKTFGRIPPPPGPVVEQATFLSPYRSQACRHAGFKAIPCPLLQITVTLRNSSWIVTQPWERRSESQVLLPPSFANEMTRTNIMESKTKREPHRKSLFKG